VSAIQLPAQLPTRRLPLNAARARFLLTRARDLLTVCGPILLELSTVIAQSWQPGYNPLRDTISSMVWGPRGWLQTANFFLISATLALLASQFKPFLATRSAKCGGLALALVGLWFIVLGICPTQSPDGPKTIQAIVHGLTVYFIVLSFPLACFLLAPAVRAGRLGKLVAGYTYATGMLGVALIATGAFLIAREAHWFGMLERLLLLNGFVWLEIVAVYFAGGAAKLGKERGYES
jgi:hypothetical protein